MSYELTRRNLLLAASGVAGAALVPGAFGRANRFMVADTYTVTLALTDVDVEKLKNNNFFLCAL